MKDIVHGSLLVESIFEITYEKVEKSVYENPLVLKGISMIDIKFVCILKDKTCIAIQKT